MRVAWDSAPDRPFTDSCACGDRTISQQYRPRTGVRRSQSGPRALSSLVLNRPQSGLYCQSQSPMCGDPLVQPSARMHATSDEAVVLVVDDDADFRDSLVALLNSIGLQTKTFGSIGELLDTKLPDVVSCLVLDVRLPGLSGLDFQAELAKTNNLIPIIFLTGYGDVPMSVKAMKLGAVDFLTKPPRDQDLLDAVTVALQRDRTRREAARELADLRSLLQNLTPREREVMGLVAKGLMNKQIAGTLGVSEATVKFHRGRLMEKLGVRSVADLVKMTQRAE
jgi:FixJ family two-component response regulator